MMNYYVQRKIIKNDTPQPVINEYGTSFDMERQFHLFCADALKNGMPIYDVDAIEWGSVEDGVIERKVYYHS